jgi:hypothetical protein
MLFNFEFRLAMLNFFLSPSFPVIFEVVVLEGVIVEVGF